MYNLYTDKTEQFEANIELTGANINDSFARLILESDKWNLTFNGTIDNNGKVTIPIDKLKGVLNEGDQGNMKLEIVAEDTYFMPWEDDFTVKTNRKVTVEVKSQSNTPLVEESKPKVTLKETKVQDNVQNELMEDYLKMLNKYNIPTNKLHEHKNRLNKVTQKFLEKNQLNEDSRKEFITNLLELLK